MHIIDCKVPTIGQLLDQIPFIHSIPAVNDLYYFNQQQLWDLAQRQLPQTTQSTVNIPQACIARYHTIKFSTLSDLVLYWHTTLGHIGKTKMLSIVRNNLILNLPKELTESAINEHFPINCLRCSIGNIQRISSPLRAEHNPCVPIGASFSVDYKKMSGHQIRIKYFNLLVGLRTISSP